MFSAGAAVQAEKDEGPVPRGHGAMILVVDDEKMIAELMGHVCPCIQCFLAKTGFSGTSC